MLCDNHPSNHVADIFVYVTCSHDDDINERSFPYWIEWTEACKGRGVSVREYVCARREVLIDDG